MARKVVNRKELRAEAEAAEALAGAAGEAGGKKTKAKEKKAPAKRKSRSKSAEPERRKLFWGLFNRSRTVKMPRSSRQFVVRTERPISAVLISSRSFMRRAFSS